MRKKRMSSRLSISQNRTKTLLKHLLTVPCCLSSKKWDFNKWTLNECIVDNLKVTIVKCAMSSFVPEKHCPHTSLVWTKHAFYSARPLFAPGVYSADSADEVLKLPAHVQLRINTLKIIWSKRQKATIRWSRLNKSLFFANPVETEAAWKKLEWIIDSQLCTRTVAGIVDNA